MSRTPLKIKRSPGVIKTPGDTANETWMPSQAYDLGEAAGLAFSFFVPFSPLAAFTSTSFAVMV